MNPSHVTEPHDHLAADTRTPEFGAHLPPNSEYALVRLIGEGGMGYVYEARDVNLGRPVAVKRMKPELAAQPVARERFLREARATALVRHDHVVPIYHVGEWDGTPFLVMPLLPGETLADRLGRGVLPPPAAARVGREAALGLAAAHAAGLVHRDVKPANIWLEAPADRVLLLDFGLARHGDSADALTQPGTVLGTPAYLAPEQANGLPSDARADLFSLGVTLYHAVTGTRPFRGPTVTSVLRAVAEHNPPPPHELSPEVPPALSGLIMRLLAKAPADRPASAAAVADELAGYGQTLVIDPVRPADEGRPGRPRRWPWAAGALLASAAALAGWSATRSDRPGGAPPSPCGTRDHRARPAAPVSYRGSVDLLVHRRDADGSDVAYPLSDVRAWPLKPGDAVKVTAEVDPAGYVYLFWIDESGTTHPLYPWVPLQWGTRPAAEAKVNRLDVKDPRGNWFKISGPRAGTETLQMLACPEPLAAAEDEVRGWFRDLDPVPFAGEKARAWFEGFDLVRHDPTRAPEYGGGAGGNGPLALQATLGRRVGGRAAFSRAVSFARLGTQ